MFILSILVSFKMKSIFKLVLLQMYIFAILSINQWFYLRYFLANNFGYYLFFLIIGLVLATISYIAESFYLFHKKSQRYIWLKVYITISYQYSIQ